VIPYTASFDRTLIALVISVNCNADKVTIDGVSVATGETVHKPGLNSG